MCGDIPQKLHQIPNARVENAHKRLHYFGHRKWAVKNSRCFAKRLKGKFGNLQDLAQAQLIDGNYASGTAINGYAYTSPVADADKYCVQATRQAASTAYRDFNVIEDGTIRFSETKTPSPVAHGEGTSLAGGEAGGTQGQGAAHHRRLTRCGLDAGWQDSARFVRQPRRLQQVGRCEVQPRR